MAAGVMRLAALATLLLVATVAVNASLDFKRVHLIDVAPRTSGGVNYLFRGNMPTNSTTFAYDLLLQYMATRAKENNVTFPSVPPYLIILSLNNEFDGEDFEHEKAFWKAAPPSLGEFINWPLGAAGLLPPNFYNETERRAMAVATGAAWTVDQLPQRMPIIHSWLNTTRDRPVAIYIHCSAGCDRTGEVIGSYRTQFLTQNLTRMYALSVSECGRPPNYFGTTALQWYCYFYTYTYRPIGDCMAFATCKMFGQCEPTHKQIAPAFEQPAFPHGSPVPTFPLRERFDDISVRSALDAWLSDTVQRGLRKAPQPATAQLTAAAP